VLLAELRNKDGVQTEIEYLSLKNRDGVFKFKSSAHVVLLACDCSELMNQMKWYSKRTRGYKQNRDGV
jgi:hypothetical protein